MAGPEKLQTEPKQVLRWPWKWIISPPVTLLFWGPKRGSGRELVFSSLASSQDDSQTDLEKERKIKT